LDYTAKKIAFKARKSIRYIGLYGFARTWAKIQGQYHMKRRFDQLPAVECSKGGHIGLIGCGNFAYSNIAYYLDKQKRGIVRAAMDVDINRAASLCRKYGLRYYTDNAEQIIRDPEIDLIYIASNHASHAEYAIDALNAGKSVHIEKPHVVNGEQLLRLCQAMSTSKGRVNLGFNRPNSRIGNEIRAALMAEQGPSMLNWFVAGHEIASDHWYFSPEEGGRILGNLCHWTDFVYRMIDDDRKFPIIITPTRAQKSDCDIAVTFVFGDGSIAAITFSAKGHTFEGVRERFAAHRGNVLISMDDFKTLTIEIVEQKKRTTHLFRDHGHQQNILGSLNMISNESGSEAGCEVKYVWETAELFLKTREALEKNCNVRVDAFNPQLIHIPAA
jgi:predicted dehydrogenase